MSKLIVILISITSFSAFAGYADLTYSEVDRRLDMLAYDKNFKVENTELYKEKEDYNVFKIKLSSLHPWSNTSFNTDFFYYKSKEKGPRPLLIIIPPILDITPLDKLMAKKFAKKGYNVFILKFNEKINDYERQLKDFNRALVSIVTSARLLIDYAETKDEIDHTKIASYGMSLGGLILGVYVGVEERVDAAVILVGGGNVPQIMARSKQFIPTRFRRKRMKAEGIENKSNFQDTLEDIVLFDPLFFAHRRSPEDVYMVIGELDTSVPTKNQWALWNAFGKPEHQSYKLGHFSSILASLFNHDLIYDFIKKRLEQE